MDKTRFNQLLVQLENSEEVFVYETQKAELMHEVTALFAGIGIDLDDGDFNQRDDGSVYIDWDDGERFVFTWQPSVRRFARDHNGKELYVFFCYKTGSRARFLSKNGLSLKWFLSFIETE